MPIQFYCPACSKKLSIGTRKAGARVSCPRCRGAIVVPAASDLNLFLGWDTPAPQNRPQLRLPPAAPAARPAATPGPWGRRLRALAVAVVLLAVAAGPASVVPAPREMPGADPAQAPPVLPRAEDPAPSILPLAQAEAAAPAEEASGKAELAVAPRTAEVTLLTEARPAVPEPARATEARPVRFAPRKERADAVARRWQSKRRSLLSDDDLRRQLLLIPELRLDKVPGSSKGLVAESARVAAAGVDLVPTVIARRPDLIGLQPRAGNDARTSREEALNLNVLAQHVRLHLETAMPGLKKGAVDPRPDPKILRDRILDTDTRAAWLRPAAIPALRQLLMHENHPVRQILVEALAEIPGPRATLALAERAVFDLHPDVRLAAVIALSGRPPSEYEPALIAGLRYPWPAVADHAAEALVALDRRQAVPKLIPLLDARDPAEPYAVEKGKKKVPAVPELVRLNHLRNCLLCHFPSFSPLDPVRGQVPNSGQRVPISALGGRAPTGGGGGWGKGGSGGVGGGSKYTTIFTWVRADITYLKQDFSVLQPVPNHGKFWPAEQRFDYLLRLRPLDKEETQLLKERREDLPSASPQREALLFALRELTGEDLGPTAADWKRLYSPVTGKRLAEPLDAPGQVMHLRDALVEAAPVRQTELLLLFKDRTGREYDRALTLALSSLAGEQQKAARTVLADRMHCLPLKDLKQRLCDDDPETRRAAVRASRQREEKAVIPDLVARLDDGHAEVARLAQEALRHLTGLDLGPTAGAGPDQRRQAIAAWLDWWEKQQQKRAGPK